MSDYNVHTEMYLGIGLGFASVDNSYLLILPFVIIGFFKKEN